MSAKFYHSQFDSPAFFSADYFDSISFNNLPAPPTNIINVSSAISLEFALGSAYILPRSVSSAMALQFNQSAAAYRVTSYNISLTTDLNMQSSAYMVSKPNINFNMEFLFSASILTSGTYKHKHTVLNIDRGYFAARQGPTRLVVYVTPNLSV